MSELNDVLKKFHQDKVKADSISSSNGSQKLWLYIEKVLAEVGKKNPRFRSSNVEFVGSSETNISALFTNEMERLVIFNIRGSVKDLPKFPGFARFQIEPSVRDDWIDCINEEGYLEPGKMISEFKNCIYSALKDTSQPFGVDTMVDIKVIETDDMAITITGSYSPDIFTANKDSYEKLKCDLNLLIGREGLPSTKVAKWLTEDFSRINIWPPFETVKEIRDNIGFGLVGIGVYARDINIAQTGSDLNLMWRYSVDRAESCILQHCPSELIHKKLFLILKAVRLYEVAECSDQVLPLTSYHMKTILLHEAHDYPDPDSWTQDKLGVRYISAMERLLKSIVEKKLSHFFFPHMNLFNGKESAMKSKIGEIVKKPKEHLEKLITEEECHKQKEFNAVLEKFYQDKAKSNDLFGYTELWLYIKNALEEVEKKYPRFRSSKVELVGSSASGVSAILTKEMDRLVIFNIKGVITDIPDSPGFARFQVDSSVRKDWKDCINEEGYLEPRRISSEFKKCFDWAVSKIKSKYPKGLPKFEQEMTEIEVEGGDSVAITISGLYGEIGKFFGKVKCDLVLLIGFEGLPPSKLAPWINERSSQIKQLMAFDKVENIRNSIGFGLMVLCVGLERLPLNRLTTWFNERSSHVKLWPTIKTVQAIQNRIGFGLVAKNVQAEDTYICKTATGLDLMWRYSVSRAETCILQNCPDKLIHKKLLVILKAVRLYEIPEGSNRTPPLTSYHMKTILLHEAHDYPDPDSWNQDKLGERFVSALQRLLKSMEENYLPHFFFPNVNLFQGEHCEIRSKIENIVEDPKEYMKRLIIAEGLQPIETEYPIPGW